MNWVKAGVDYAAPIAFVAVLLITRKVELATWVLVGVSALALAVGLIVERRLAPLPLISGVLAMIFGGLTLVFHDPSFVKMKMTVLEGALAVTMFGGVIFKKNPLKALMGDAVVLPDFAWRNLTIRYGLFFLACAIANEFIWRTQTTEFWATWKLISIGAAIVFAFLQTPYLMKHMTDPEKAKALDPPDGGF
jgi:intracellular septation protein